MEKVVELSITKSYEVNLQFMKGTIKTLTQRGFGFIGQEDEDDIFFHSNDLSGVEFDDLEVGDEVEFEVVESQKGPKAVDVTRV
ncbi:MAG: cold-shock protein [Patescibacteria group bacterium]